MHAKLKLLVAISLSCTALGVYAKATPEELAQLGQNLTPMGAEKAGSADGKIPAYAGGLCSGERIPNSFAAEQALFTINAGNADQYKDQLTIAHHALLKKYPDWSMPVYPTHRTFCAPQSVYDTIKTEAALAELSADGSSLTGRTDSSTPFPLPKTALEAMYNHMLRSRTGGFTRAINWVVHKPNGDRYQMLGREKLVYDQNMNERTPGRLFSWVGQYFEPATLDGSILLTLQPSNPNAEPTKVWGYNSGLRRVRRLPDATYDYVPEGTEGYRVGDQYDGYSGATDRYEWKLVGKREMIMPYNNYKAIGPDVKDAGDLLIPGKPVIKPELLRYETHRVWVIEAALKEGQRHIYPKRTFYLDEDSWIILAEDTYNTRGEIWRLGEHQLVQYADGPTAWYGVNAWIDLSAGASVVQRDDPTSVKLHQKGTMREFSADNLRRMGTK